MFSTARRTVAAVAALAALALGGSVIADAATNSTTSPQSPSGGQPPQGGGPRGGRHVGANGQREQALPASVAAKVRKAALGKIPGASVERIETDVDHGSPYEAHLRKADGTQLEVLVNKSFEVTAVNTMQMR
jgi:hypothetical protein